MDVFDLVRKLRHKELSEKQRLDQQNPAISMYAFAPVIGYKPSSGAMIGVAGNLAFYRGDPKTTHISSSVASLTLSTLKQVSATARFGVLTRDDAWKIDGDNRFQWTSQDTFGLGTETTKADKVNMKFDYFRIFETAYRELYQGLFAGVGFHYSAHTDVEPGEDAAEDWSESPDGRGIAFVGQEADGATGVFVQDFVPGRNTEATRRPLARFDEEAAVESFDLSPDGKRVVAAVWVQVFSLMEGSALDGIEAARPAPR